MGFGKSVIFLAGNVAEILKVRRSFDIINKDASIKEQISLLFLKIVAVFSQKAYINYRRTITLFGGMSMKKDFDQIQKSHMSDREIIDLYWDRDERAIKETDVKYKKYLYTIAYNILHNNMDCEECLNDTYLGTWNAIPPQRPSVFQAFLSSIMRNTAVGKYKMNSAQKRGAAEITLSIDEIGECIPYPSAEEEYMCSELARIISDYIRSLPERSAFIFICRYWCADKISNIAAMLHISERTVFNELSSIRNGLRDILIKEGYFNE